MQCILQARKRLANGTVVTQTVNSTESAGVVATEIAVTARTAEREVKTMGAAEVQQ